MGDSDTFFNHLEAFLKKRKPNKDFSTILNKLRDNEVDDLDLLKTVVEDKELYGPLQFSIGVIAALKAYVKEQAKEGAPDLALSGNSDPAVSITLKSNPSTIARNPVEPFKMHDDIHTYRPNLPSVMFPVCLACEVFSNFRKTVGNPEEEPSKEAQTFAIKLQIEMSDAFSKESDREQRLHELLSGFLEVQFITELKAASLNTDGMLLYKSALLMNLEVKNELGSSGDATSQNLAYYINYWNYNTCEDWKVRYGLRPTFLLQVSGASLEVACACMNMEGVHFGALTPFINLTFVPHDIENQRRVASVLDALKIGLVELRNYYDTDNKPDPAFPFIKECRLSNDSLLGFNYVENLKENTRLVYKCTSWEKDIPIVVKFTPFKYGTKAHRALADSAMAPRLLHVIDLKNGFTIVVMEFIDGQIKADGLVSQEEMEKLKETVKYLHSKGFVHGDLRPRNIIWRGSIPIVLDFDFSGITEDEPLYPATLNMAGVEWPDGVGPKEPITPIHDLQIIEKTFSARNVDKMEVELHSSESLKRKVAD